MSTVELKKSLIQRIVEINDVSFLKAIKTILDIRSNEEVISLTPELRKEILTSKKEIEKGLFFPITLRFHYCHNLCYFTSNSRIT